MRKLRSLPCWVRTLFVTKRVEKKQILRAYLNA